MERMDELEEQYTGDDSIDEGESKDPITGSPIAKARRRKGR